MTFEEFFKKKRIDLPALEKADGALFSDFKTHFDEMGEKSFDHTKKYWFNKLRRQYPAPAEIREPKPHIANPIAEQTVTESLSENAAPVTKQGFVPRFKANIAKPAPPENTETPAAAEQTTPTPQPVAKQGFVPRFKAANMPKPAIADEKVERAAPGDENTGTTSTENAPTPPPAAKPGFTPRFKAANMPKPAPNPNKDTDASA